MRERPTRRNLLTLVGAATILGKSMSSQDQVAEVSDDARSRIAFEHVKPAYNELTLADGDADEGLKELKAAVAELEEEMKR